MIKVLQKAADVLEVVAHEQRPIFTDIQQATGLNKATLSRLLKTLEQLQYVERAPDRSYGIGPAVVRLARPALRRESLGGLAERHARTLAGKLQELVTVATIRHGRRYNLARATVDQVVTVNARLEQRPSPFDTATGRVLLAHLEEEPLGEVLKVSGLPGETWPEVDGEDELRAALERIRRVGHAHWTAKGGDAEALAVPIFGPDGRVWAAVGSAAPGYRMDEERRRDTLQALQEAAAEMGRELALQGSWTEECRV